MRFLDPIRPRDGVLGTLFFLAAMALPGWVFFVHEGGPRSTLEAAVIKCSRHKALWTRYLDREPYAVALKADDALAPAPVRAPGRARSPQGSMRSSSITGSGEWTPCFLS